MSYYYNGTTSKRVFSAIQVKEVEVDYFVGCETLDHTQTDTFVIPQTLSNFPILTNTKFALYQFKGNSVSFNQLARELNSSLWWLSNATGSISGGIASFTATAQYGQVYRGSNKVYKNHKYLISCEVKVSSAIENIVSLNLYYLSSTARNIVSTSWQKISTIGTLNSPNDEASADLRLMDTRTSGWDNVQCKNIMLFDLTTMFGAGNEPTSVAEFEALYPKDYYPYQQNDIKSTTISKVESFDINNVKLGQINIPTAPLTLRGIDTLQDELVFEEQENGTYNAVLTRKIDSVDLSTLTWNYNNNYQIWRASLSVKNKGKLLASNYIYEDVDPNDLSINGICSRWSWWGQARQIFVKNGSDTTTPTGDLLYELATPTTETIATGLTFDQVSSLFEIGGTIQIGNSETDYIEVDSSLAFAVRRFRAEEQ